MRVAIVNDLRLAVEALKRCLAQVPGATLAWTAADGREAVERCAADRPDLVLMDLVMPVLDGVEATRRIMRDAPCPILVVTATMEGNLERVYNALGAGALDAVEGPVFTPAGLLEGEQAVVRKMRTVMRLGTSIGAQATVNGPPTAPPAVPPVGGVTATRAGGLPLIALGASTGGPEAVARVLRGLARDAHPPVVVVQHLDAAFVPGLVQWLAVQAGRPVRCAESGSAPEAGLVHVACSNDHLILTPERRFAYLAEPADLPYRPSVDVFFNSLALHWPDGGAAALLTGMGRDGAAGLFALRRAGWRTFAQDEASSVVYGMPRAARELGAAQEVLPASELGAALEAAWSRRSLAARGPGGPE